MSVKLYNVIVICIGVIFLSSMPAEARKRHRHVHVTKHRITQGVSKPAPSPSVSSASVCRLDLVNIESDWGEKEEIKYLQLSWQDTHEKSSSSFVSIPPMIEVLEPKPQPKPKIKPEMTTRERLGAIVFGTFMILGCMFLATPRKRFLG